MRFLFILLLLLFIGCDDNPVIPTDECGVPNGDNINEDGYYCGDLNVVHQHNDIYSTRTLDEGKYPGTLLEERIRFSEMLDLGYLDIWRHRNPDRKKYTWWNPRIKGRDKNIGWRLDYFLIRTKDEKKIKDVQICDDIYGSDHCPIYLEL